MKKILLSTLVLISMLVVATSAVFAKPGEHKVYVCKYVGQPGVDERLKDGKNPIVVDSNATVGTWFNDAQGRSYVLATYPQDPEPTAADCPGGSTPTPPTPTEPPTETVTPTEPPVCEENCETATPPPPTATPQKPPTNKPEFKCADFIAADGSLKQNIVEARPNFYDKAINSGVLHQLPDGAWSCKPLETGGSTLSLWDGIIAWLASLFH